MQRIFIIYLSVLCVILFTSTKSASAQTSVAQETTIENVTDTQLNYTQHEEIKTKERLKGSFEIDYSSINDNTALGVNINRRGLVLFGEYQTIETDIEGVKSMMLWGGGVGLNKRIYIFGILYVEGRIGASYHEMYAKFDDGSSTKEGSWGGFAATRAGLKLIDGVCANIGYKWNFTEFKFTEAKYKTIGVSFLF